MYCSRCAKPILRSATFCLGCGWPTSDARSEPGRVAEDFAAVAAELPPAGFWLRVLATSIDTWILLLGILPLSSLAYLAGTRLGLETAGRIALFVALVLVVLVGAWLYGALSECSERQATIGKRTLGLAVIDRHGARIGLGRASGRHFGKLLSALPLYAGFVMAGLTEQKQALHDLVAGTRVVRRRPAGTGAVLLGWFLTALLFLGGLLLELYGLQRSR